MGQPAAHPGPVFAHRCLGRGFLWWPGTLLFFLLGTGDGVAQPHELRSHIKVLCRKETGLKSRQHRRVGTEQEGWGTVGAHLPVVEAVEPDIGPGAEPGGDVAGNLCQQWFPHGTVGEPVKGIQGCLFPLGPCESR